MRVQQLRDRHLRSVPVSSSAFNRWSQDFARTIRGIELANRVKREQREVEDMLDEANRDGREQAAACLENALAELRAAREGCK